MKRKQYIFAILKHNNKYFEKESTVDPRPQANQYDPNCRYAIFVKQRNKDGTESTLYIVYKNDLKEATKYIESEEHQSWFNYPKGKYKDTEGNIGQL